MRVLLLGLVMIWAAPAQAQERADPIIDMHFHAMPADSMGPGQSICSPYDDWPILDPVAPIESYLRDFTGDPDCPRRFTSPSTDAELIEANAEVLERRNIVALAGGTERDVGLMRARSPQRIIPALGFGSGESWPDLEQIRTLHREGKVAALAEITTQYAGIAPGDARLEPYWALAEELDIPVGIHMGPGPPGVAYFAAPAYRMALTDPMQLEEILLRRPKLRVFVMHAGWPMSERMIALMYAHPQVYVETGVIDHAYPRAEFHSYLKRLVDAGFGRRIMFGSDQMVWPGVIEVAIESIESAEFLSAEQKRGILFNNAARFLRLSAEQVATIRRH
jgi:predicted TIM-barrel fold metal-dependent hydrolase